MNIQKEFYCAATSTHVLALEVKNLWAYKIEAILQGIAFGASVEHL